MGAFEIGVLIFSLLVGVFNYFQMRKAQQTATTAENQLDGTIADEGVSFSDIAGTPHMFGNVVDMWGRRTEAIKQKGGKK